MNNKCSIILSFRNEENNIKEILRRITEVFNNIESFDYEIIFVNDSSDDNSLEILKNEIEKNRKIKIINMSRRFGYTQCVLAGLENSEGNCALTIDCDLQDPPELIKDMIKEFNNGADLVHTMRMKRLGESKLKMFITKIGYKIINFFSDIDLKTNVGDFRLFSRRAIEEILKVGDYEPYLRGVSVWVGYKQVIIPYERQSRHSGSTHFSLLNLNSFLRGPLNEFLKGLTSFSNGPLYFIFFNGLFISFFSIIFIIYGFIIKFFNLSMKGVPGIIIIISFFFGILFLNMGIFGLYLAKIFDQTKKRPRYIIDKIIKKKDLID